MLFLSQNAADRCLIIVPEAFIFSFFNDREVVIAATSLTLAHLLFNKEDKPEAVHLQKTAEGPERRRRRWGGTQGDRAGEAKARRFPDRDSAPREDSKNGFRRGVGCQLLFFLVEDTEGTLLHLFFSLPWAGEQLIFEFSFVHICLSPPPHPAGPSESTPEEPWCSGTTEIDRLDPESKAYYRLPHLTWEPFTFPYLPFENFCETPFLRWYNYMAISKKEKSTHFTLDSFQPLIRKGDVRF